ncbi:MAG TPA: DUF1697 domain-containing protein [Acidimicrobiia bacterium]|nr:DUF1697 domain-containing protein [Acidimicrobiia bacterium]
MTRCVALLRGIGPANPNMRNEHLRRVAEGVGLQNVTTFISSGNVLFETDSDDMASVESTLEGAWLDELGFRSTTIIRTEDELGSLVELDPYTGLDHGPATYLLTTFAKSKLDISFDIPHQPPDHDYRVIAATDRELFTITDTTTERTPDVMAWLEREFGKEITSRTWLTVTRILRKMR